MTLDNETKELMDLDRKAIEDFQNATPPVFSPEELHLFHQLLVQTPFAEAQIKMIAAGAQAKIEQFVSQ